MSRIKRINVRYGQIVFDLDDIDRIMEEYWKILDDMLLLKNMPADFPVEKYSETDFQK